jgi:hypothetical protein
MDLVGVPYLPYLHDFVSFCDQNVSVHMGPMVNGYGVMGVYNSHQHTPVNRSNFTKLCFYH